MGGVGGERRRGLDEGDGEVENGQVLDDEVAVTNDSGIVTNQICFKYLHDTLQFHSSDLNL